jgi:hypothetical protein
LTYQRDEKVDESDGRGAAPQALDIGPGSHSATYRAGAMGFAFESMMPAAAGRRRGRPP